MFVDDSMYLFYINVYYSSGADGFVETLLYSATQLDMMNELINLASNVLLILKTTYFETLHLKYWRRSTTFYSVKSILLSHWASSRCWIFFCHKHFDPAKYSV